MLLCMGCVDEDDETNDTRYMRLQTTLSVLAVVVVVICTIQYTTGVYMAVLIRIDLKMVLWFVCLGVWLVGC